MKNPPQKIDITDTFKKKIDNLKEIIHKTILSSHRYKTMDIYGPNELNVCITTLEIIYSQLDELLEKIVQKILCNKSDINNLINNIVSEIVIIIKSFGTDSITDLINLLIYNEYIDEYFSDSPLCDKFKILNSYAHPINFKCMIWKPNRNKPDNENIKILQKNRLIEDCMICESSENLDCFDLMRTSKSFQTKVYGIKVAIHDYKNRKTYIIACIVHDVLLSCFNNNYIQNQINCLNSEIPNDTDFIMEHWQKFMSSLTLKELLVYNNCELYQKYQGIVTQLQLIKQKTISQIVKEFINNDLFSQRTTLMQLLIKSSHHEFQYLAYLLYDLLSNENNGNIDTTEQTLLYDSFPWNVKKYFRDAMKQTIQYTNNLSNFDNSKIPLEQQICLLKADDCVKEKAILKLKEVKAKSEDSGTKARQYLDGLLKIPFNIYREEQILTVMKDTHTIFHNILSKINTISKENDVVLVDIEYKEKYTTVELIKHSEKLESDYVINTIEKSIKDFEFSIKSLKKDNLINIINFINNLIKINGLKYSKIVHSGRKNFVLQNYICDFIVAHKKNYLIINSIYNNFTKVCTGFNNINHINNVIHDIDLMKKNITNVSTYISNVNTTLNNAVYGHNNAKRQIERIIGQWINGEKSGYCFGFEGPPGVGKTSLAKKGISECLKDEHGVSRPFSFIAVGGSSNGSTLEGHNYTYVGSTWGKIVDILIETKCMNPVIFIDELDKISKTEHGKELTGILTHLIDSTQNDSFQDKYYSGIDLNLSKALFIFSYNDVDSIDRILLDRIHRIKFKHLSMAEKVVITNKYILPEIYNKMGLDNTVIMNDSIIEFLINTYTNEPGVRKLKELLFEIIGELNLSLLLNTDTSYNLPIVITIYDIKYKYLKERLERTIKKINDTDEIGVINGLWANSVGQGGLLHIEAMYGPATGFLELQLTGMQGDVMKESMTVSKTVAWSLLTNEKKEEFLELVQKKKCYGIHLHVPEGATPKDGPSAGAAITTVIYSLLMERKINRNFAMTGEICLQGKVTAIGGLDLKIMGGLDAGATKFIYPCENEKHYKEFYNNLKDKSILDGIEFYKVDNIQQVLDLILL